MIVSPGSNLTLVGRISIFFDDSTVQVRKMVSTPSVISAVCFPKGASTATNPSYSHLPLRSTLTAIVVTILSLSSFIVAVTDFPGGPVPVTFTVSPLYTIEGIVLMVRGIFSVVAIPVSSPSLRLIAFSFPLASTILKSTLSAV